MQKYDPNGVFLNKFGRRIKGASSELTIDSKVKHCALQDHCFCTEATDCATGQFCGQLYGFRVCEDLPAKVLPLPLVNSVSSDVLTVIAKQFLGK